MASQFDALPSSNKLHPQCNEYIGVCIPCTLYSVLKESLKSPHQTSSLMNMVRNLI